MNGAQSNEKYDKLRSIAQHLSGNTTYFYAFKNQLKNKNVLCWLGGFFVLLKRSERLITLGGGGISVRNRSG